MKQNPNTEEENVLDRELQATPSRRLSPAVWQIILFAFYTTWQMGVIFFSSTSLSINSRTSLPLSADATDAIIVMGYIVSAVVIGIFQQRLLFILRSVMCVSLAATLAMYAPLSYDLLTVLFYVQAFCCVFMICGYMTVAITLFSSEAELKRITASVVILGAFSAVMHSDAFALPFSVFNAVSCVCQIFIIVFLFTLPAHNETPFLKRTQKVFCPKLQIFGLLFMAFSSGMLICFSNTISESVPHGLTVFYVCSIPGAITFSFLVKKLRLGITRIFRLLMVASTFGFVLALSSYAVKPLLYAACAVLGGSMIIGEVFTYYGIAVFDKYPSKAITPLIIAVTIPAAALPMIVLDAFRTNTVMLYAIFCIIAVIMLVVYTVLEPFFNRELNLACAEPELAPRESASAPGFIFNELSEQENNLAALLLKGYTESAICEEMNISINTQKSYRKSVYVKLGIHSKRELFELAEKQVTANI